MSLDSIRLQDLLATARLGSEEALWRLLAASRDYLLLVANRRIERALQARAHPSDLVGDTLIEARRDFASFEGESAADWLRWIRRLLLHNLANFQRDQHRQKRSINLEVPLDEDIEDRAIITSVLQTPSAELIAKEENVSLEVALTRLCPEDRLVVTLRHRDGQTFEQIGNVMNRTADSARRLWARAILKLQKEMETKL